MSPWRAHQRQRSPRARPSACSSTASDVTKATTCRPEPWPPPRPGLAVGAQTVTSAQASASVRYAGMPTTFPTTTLRQEQLHLVQRSRTPVGRSTTANSDAELHQLSSIKLTLSPNKTVHAIAVPDTLVSFSTTATNATATVDLWGAWIVTVPAVVAPARCSSGVPYKTTQEIAGQERHVDGHDRPVVRMRRVEVGGGGLGRAFSSSGSGAEGQARLRRDLLGCERGPELGHLTRRDTLDGPTGSAGADALPPNGPELVSSSRPETEVRRRLPLSVLQELLRGR